MWECEIYQQDSGLAVIREIVKTHSLLLVVSTVWSVKEMATLGLINPPDEKINKHAGSLWLLFVFHPGNYHNILCLTTYLSQLIQHFKLLLIPFSIFLMQWFEANCVMVCDTYMLIEGLLSYLRDFKNTGMWDVLFSFPIMSLLYWTTGQIYKVIGCQDVIEL